MIVGCCVKCKYLDLRDDFEGALCPRCNSNFVSLGVTGSKWNLMSEGEQNSLIEEYVCGEYESEEEPAEVYSGGPVTDSAEDSLVDSEANPVPENTEDSLTEYAEAPLYEGVKGTSYTSEIAYTSEISYTSATSYTSESPVQHEDIDIGYSVKDDMIECPECEYRVLKGTANCPKCGSKLSYKAGSGESGIGINKKLNVHANFDTPGEKLKKILLPALVVAAFIVVVVLFVLF